MPQLYKVLKIIIFYCISKLRQLTNSKQEKKKKLIERKTHYIIVGSAAPEVPYFLQASPRTRLFVRLAGIRMTERRSRVLHAGINILQTVHQRFRADLAAVDLRAELVCGVHETLQFRRRRRFRRFRDDFLEAVEQRRGANRRERSNGRTGRQCATSRRNRGRCSAGAGGGRTLPTPRHVSHPCKKHIS